MGWIMMAVAALAALVLGMLVFGWLSRLDGARSFEVLFGVVAAIAGPVVALAFWGNLPLMVVGAALLLYGVWQASHAWAHHDSDNW